MNTEKAAWDFVEKYYPNYSSCNEIAENNDLKLLIDGEGYEGTKAHDLWMDILDDLGKHVSFVDDKMALEEANRRYNESCKAIYEKAIEGYLEAQKLKEERTISITWSIGDINPLDEEDNPIPLTDEQKREILEDIKSNHDANIGVNWENIDYHVNNYLNDRNLI